MKKYLHDGRGAIFDLDGTLLDTLGDLAATGNYALEAYGFAPVPADGFRSYVGNGMRTMLRRAVGASLRQSRRSDEISEDLLSGMLGKALDYYRDNWRHATRPYPGIGKMLEDLAGRGVPLGVCSNKDDASVQKTIRHFFPATPFVGLLGQSAKTPLKPDASGALQLADMMRLCPRDIVFVGDTRVDMQTAGNAGMFAVGVSWGFRPKEELLEYGARLIVDSPADISRCFGYSVNTP